MCFIILVLKVGVFAMSGFSICYLSGKILNPDPDSLILYAQKPPVQQCPHINVSENFISL